MYNFNKKERVFISGVLIGSIIGSIAAAVAFFFNTQAIIKGSVKKNVDKEKTEPLPESSSAEVKPKRPRRKKAESMEGNAGNK